ncbi:GH1 family beta-glucosidase [Sulfoacidibacillus ferrooxidans]|uniref:Beta-glucosidase n=1 Tax=Sulfoacidibacillus ferrooxidans TaxID=2005001 RepID=A0A9X1V6C3_9BACL|nr:GH1 family beta-glucosidase [Sulfoacidibacillus ferrooxidans]MCI0182331.1 Beta-glucosidase B [Sulfoacidibacillus ferrooxidans]
MSEKLIKDMMNVLPRDFQWGVATSSYQIEGAVNEDGRGPSIWDTFCEVPGKVSGHEDGKVACDHYHLYPSDIQLMSDLGIRNYRFSIAWSRIFPEGKGKLNEKGIAFYDRLIDTLLSHGINPMATMYHWDLPEALQRDGGWLNRDTAYRFADYSMALTDRFSDRVNQWITHNEPWCTAFLGNIKGEHAPGITDAQIGLDVSHHLLLSHGLAVQAYRENNHKGKIGITLNLTPAYAATESEADRRAANYQDVFSNRWFLDPIFKGKYPEELGDIFGTMPSVVKDGDLDLISLPNDFMGVNYYSYGVIAHDEHGGVMGKHVTPQDRITDMGWPINGKGLSDLLIRLTKEYGKLPYYITENGAAYPDVVESDGSIHDVARLAYLKEHLEALTVALQAGVDLRGYYLWSFMDNFEWAFGYSKRFGAVYVDYETQKRTPKDSILWYSQWIRELSAK